MIWKPSPAATYSNYLVNKVFLEAGLPPSVIQFVPGDPEVVVKEALNDREFAALHFTGSTSVFRGLWKEIGMGVGEGRYRSYPRIVGETGGKNFHLVHPSAEIKNAVHQAVRGAFEYQGEGVAGTGWDCRLTVPCRPEMLGFIAALCCFLHLATVQGDVARGDGEDQSRASRAVGELYGSCHVSVSMIFSAPIALMDIYDSGKPGFDKIVGYINKAKEEGGEILHGGSADDSKGYFVQPTIILTKDPKSVTMREEIFGPVVTVS